MAVGTNFVIEEDEEDVETVESGDPLFASLGKAQSAGIVPLAFTIQDDLPPLKVSGLTITWTREAIATFRRIRDEAQSAAPDFKRKLPFASLRGLLDASLPGVSRIVRDVGLDTHALDPARQEQDPFVYVDRDDLKQYERTLGALLDNWIIDFLVPQYIKPGGVSFDWRDQLMRLSGEQRLVQIEPIADPILPWAAGQTGTATPPNKRRGYQLLVDHAARCVAGRELFAGLGPMRRIVMTRTSAQSEATLITDPIELVERDLFSLVVTFEVVTFPSVGQPLITVRVSKRRWLSQLSERTADRHSISGSVFSSKCADRAISFSVTRERDVDGSRRWLPDNAYEALKTVLDLPLSRMDAPALLRGEGDTADSRILLAHRAAISAVRHRIKVGVPERDKLEAFENLARALEPMGLLPFRSYRRVSTRHSDDYEEVAKTINASTLLSAALESSDLSQDSPTAEFLASLDDEAIDVLLRRQFKLGLEQIQQGQKIVRFRSEYGKAQKDQSVELETLIRANTEAVRRLCADVQPILVIFHDERADSALRIVKAVARLLWGDAIEIRTNKLPAGTHGPARSLPGSDRLERERSDLRVQAWRSYATQLASMNRRLFCLVMAPDRYPNPDDPTRALRDDRINKAAGRQALATFAQASVQYLLPPNVARDSDQIDLVDFLHRAQAALRDLISAHSGRIDGVSLAVSRSFSHVPAMRETMPKEILGITVVRKMAGRARGGIGTTFLPVALRIDVETGRCDLRCAYEGRNNTLTVSQWQPFSAALSTVSKVSPVRLAEKRDAAKVRFQRFVEQVISESVDSGAQPFVLIDSSNCVHLWPWLADQRLDSARIQIGEKDYMEQSWKSARIVRIRQELAPNIVERKEQRYARSELDDERARETLPCDVTISAPTSSPGLFRLAAANADTGVACYLSVGRKTLHQSKRGPSCYSETQAALPVRSEAQRPGPAARLRNQADVPLFIMQKRKPWTGQWPSPNPVEIVVALRQPLDDPDRIAELVERLRYGFGHYAEWTALPAPLFFERVVRDYVSGFAFESGDDADSSEEG